MLPYKNLAPASRFTDIVPDLRQGALGRENGKGVWVLFHHSHPSQL